MDLMEQQETKTETAEMRFFRQVAGHAFLYMTVKQIKK
jgi:hypothetical protein